MQATSSGLQTRIVIKQAKGILANRWHVSPEIAFAHMRSATRARRMRIHDLAAAVLHDTDDLPPPDLR